VLSHTRISSSRFLSGCLGRRICTLRNLKIDDVGLRQVVDLLFYVDTTSEYLPKLYNEVLLPSTVHARSLPSPRYQIEEMFYLCIKKPLQSSPNAQF